MAESSSNKKIAKNSIFLYMRSFLIMAVSLYSSRIILEAIGIADYGLYGAIGSLVAMFVMINGVLAAGTSRFMTYELGRGNQERLAKTFSASFILHVGLAVILLILLETIGLWFVNHKLNIPEGRTFAANVVYQLSVFTSIFSLTQVPYTASIIAHEKMHVYAYVGIAEVTFKLALIFLLLYCPFADNLIAYAIILAIWTLGLQIWYRYYCHRHFKESHLKIVHDGDIYKNMLSYSAWDFIGQFCATGNSQGLNILLNIFFGVTINAARAVAYQVENAVTQFSTNFLTAVNPQITKAYAQTDHDRFIMLIKESSKFAFFLLFMISMPAFIEAPYLLKIWLAKVPDTSVSFLRFALFFGVFRIITRPVITGTHATGNIKYLNLTSGLYSALTFLSVIYIAYKLGAPYWICFIVNFINGIIVTIFEIRSLHRNVPFNIRKFVPEIIIKPWVICLLATIPAVIIHHFMHESFLKLCAVSLCSIVCIGSATYLFGLSKSQREWVKSLIGSQFNRKG
ncbi:MAG: hypothetical protein K2H86_04270 [Muribaculaceae bacterium]|nr:hypothetical protein [Muribaculaceae bacterium]